MLDRVRQVPELFKLRPTGIFHDVLIDEPEPFAYFLVRIEFPVVFLSPSQQLLAQKQHHLLFIQVVQEERATIQKPLLHALEPHVV